MTHRSWRDDGRLTVAAGGMQGWRCRKNMLLLLLVVMVIPPLSLARPLMGLFALQRLAHVPLNLLVDAGAAHRGHNASMVVGRFRPAAGQGEKRDCSLERVAVHLHQFAVDELIRPRSFQKPPTMLLVLFLIVFPRMHA